MTKRIIVSMLLLSLLATLGVLLANKNSDYLYTFSVLSINEEKRDRDFVNGVDSYLKKIKWNPTDHRSMAMLSRLYLERAKELDSKEYYLQAARYAYRSIAILPLYSPAAYFVLADIALVDHEFEKALHYAQIILTQKKSNSPEASLILAKSHFALGNFEQAMIFADELIALFPSEKAYTLRATILAGQGRDLEAMNDFEEAIKLLEDDPVQASYTRAAYARFLISRSAQKGNLATAKNLLEEALRITPHSSFALELMGSLYEKEKKFQDAVKYFKLGFKQSKQIIFLFKEAKSYQLAGNTELASTLFAQTESLLRPDLKNAKSTSTIDLIRLLLERGRESDFSESLRLATREKNLRPTPEALILYSWALEVNGHLLEARKSLRGMLARNIHGEEVLKRAAIVETKLNNQNLANIYKNQTLTSSAL